MNELKQSVGLREKIVALEAEILKAGGKYGDQEFCPLKHTFAEGLYVREIRCPAGALIVTKIHKKDHPFFVLKGVVEVITENGRERIEAPYYGITRAGTKRACLVVEDCVWITVHQNPNDHTDLEKIEAEVIAKDFDEIESQRKMEMIEWPG